MCRNGMAGVDGVPREVIMEIGLVDLTIDLEATGKEWLSGRDGYGASWWYLTCDCDDAYVDVVKEMISDGDVVSDVVGDGVRDGVGDGVRDNVGYGVGDGVNDGVGYGVSDSVCRSRCRCHC